MVDGDALAKVCAEALAAHGTASVSIAVAHRGEVVLEQAHGWADTAARRPATPGTAYAVASVSKAITATGVCLAADAGLLGLDDPVPGPDGPDGPDGSPAPTVRQLLRHRGGLGGHVAFAYPGGPALIDPDRYQAPLAAPDARFEYANLGFHRLGGLLERSSGQQLGDFLRERVLRPLGMADTHYGAAYPGSAPTAERYTADGRAYPAGYLLSTPAAGAAWATAGDLARFGHGAPGLLAPGTAAAVAEAPAITDHVGYGLGWILSTGPGPQVRSHGGGMGGVATMVVAVPELELSLAVLTNHTIKAARDAVVDHLLTELVPEYHPGKIAPYAPDPARPVPLAVGRWAGVVRTPEGEVPILLDILTESRVSVAFTGGEPVRAAAAAGREYRLRSAVALQLPTDDARRNSPMLALELNEAGGKLVGRAAAYADGDRSGLLGNYLVHACELSPI
ncbi:serine hydrolase domain-containing protein [Kitasatospora sp. NPDC006697]|uniref:serine hydrolase domain-containing protein n=1 Tax=Kitasatospora sp. NPDC006697 TaxID=3364020 RepID=UPI003692AC1A